MCGWDHLNGRIRSNLVQLELFPLMSLGNVYIAGSTTTAIGEFSDGFLSKFDAVGALLWTLPLTTPRIDAGSCVSTDQAGNVYLAGNTNGGLSGPRIGYVRCIRRETQWSTGAEYASPGRACTPAAGPPPSSRRQSRPPAGGVAWRSLSIVFPHRGTGECLCCPCATSLLSGPRLPPRLRFH